MVQIKAYKIDKNSADLQQLSVKREWMDETDEAHAYKCFPVSLTNQLGWGVSFPEDITFIWDGISDSTPDHIKIISGDKYAFTSRGNATVSFNTGIVFKTNEETSLLTMPVPNYLRDGIQQFTTIISSSFFQQPFPCALRVTRPNVEITIKANTPIFSIVPINLQEIQNSEVIFESPELLTKLNFNASEYNSEAKRLNMLGKWSNFYRDATDHLGNVIGKHQVKSIKLKVRKNNE
jgi:hypothetical protein